MQKELYDHSRGEFYRRILGVDDPTRDPDSGLDACEKLMAQVSPDAERVSFNGDHVGNNFTGNATYKFKQGEVYFSIGITRIRTLVNGRDSEHINEIREGLAKILSREVKTPVEIAEANALGSSE